MGEEASETKPGAVELPLGGYWGLGAFAVLMPWWALMHQVIAEQSGAGRASGLLPGAALALPFGGVLGGLAGEMVVWAVGLAATVGLVWLGRLLAERSGLGLLALTFAIGTVGWAIGSAYRM